MSPRSLSPTPSPARSAQLRDRPARQRRIRPARLSEGHLAYPGRGRRSHRERTQQRKLPREYATVSDGDANWQGLSFPQATSISGSPTRPTSQSTLFRWNHQDSRTITDILGARVLAVLAIPSLQTHLPRRQHQGQRPGGQVPGRAWSEAADFNSYGSRRGNHEVMVRGTFANVRCATSWPRHRRRRDPPAPRRRRHVHIRRQCEVRRARVPLVILAGKEYGSGSSRDWAAKGPNLLGVKAVIAESFERIHGPTSSAWAFCRCNSPMDKRRIPRPHRRRDLRLCRAHRTAHSRLAGGRTSR